MRSVNIAKLKDHLSRYLRAVRRGEEILIRDRKVPIAMIVPLPQGDSLEAEEQALIASGQLRPAKRPLPRSFWSMPGPRISARRAAQAVVANREED